MHRRDLRNYADAARAAVNRFINRIVLRLVVHRRLAIGWSRSDRTVSHQPDGPKLFYVHLVGPEVYLPKLLDCVRLAIHWRNSKTAPQDLSAWSLTRPVKSYQREIPALSYRGKVRGFRAKLRLGTLDKLTSDHVLTLESYAHYNNFSEDEGLHHTVLCLEFAEIPEDDRWQSVLSEGRVSEAVSAIAIRLTERFPSITAVELISGGWRHLRFDIPYYGSELNRDRAPSL